jgi:hypothetical protein
MRSSATIVTLRSHSRRVRSELRRASILGDDIRRLAAANEVRALLALMRQLERAIREADAA